MEANFIQKYPEQIPLPSRLNIFYKTKTLHSIGVHTEYGNPPINISNISLKLASIRHTLEQRHIEIIKFTNISNRNNNMYQ